MPMTIKEWAASLSISHQAAGHMARKLIPICEIKSDPMGSWGGRRWVMLFDDDELAALARTSKPKKVKVEMVETGDRICLKCGRRFQSAGIHNRLCDDCRADDCVSGTVYGRENLGHRRNGFLMENPNFGG